MSKKDFKTSLKNMAALSKLSGYASKKGRTRKIKGDPAMETESSPSMLRGTSEIEDAANMEGRGTPSIIDVDTSGESIENLKKKMQKIKDSAK